jgi:hypothetical protein
MSDEPTPSNQDGTIHARRILNEMALPAGALRQEHRELEERFVAAMGPLVDLMMNAEPRGEGVPNFAVPQLLARASNDLFASVHLMTHGYLSQAYNTLRTGYETLDLVELLATKPGEAERWEETAEGYREFSPGAVRKKLGRDSFDEVYSHFCEAAHPRFNGAHLNSFGERRDGSDEVHIVVRVGPTLLDESPEQWFLAMFLTTTVGLLCARIGRLVDLGKLDRPVWQAGAMENQRALQEMSGLIAKQLSEFGIDASHITAEYEHLPTTVDAQDTAAAEP